MQTAFGFDSLHILWPGCCLCIGVFDGVHRGHAAVIRETVRRARSDGVPAVALTFDRHPLALLSPGNAPRQLLSPAANMIQMCALGVDAAIVVAFDKEFSELSAEDFFADYLVARLKATRVCVGHDFAFGHKRLGTAQWLAQRIDTFIQPPVEIDGIRISSTAIRQAILKGDVGTAARMLGRNFILSGVTVPGQRLGKQLGVPTANLSCIYSQVIPASGIYAGRAHIDGKVFSAAISVGDRPSVPGAGFAVEAHLLDYEGGELYGRSLDLEFAERIRDELSFESTGDLVNQMILDIEETRSILVKHG